MSEGGGQRNKPCSDCQGPNQEGKEGASSCLLQALLPTTNYYCKMVGKSCGKCQGLEMVGCELEIDGQCEEGLLPLM
jgi:hypothetical protein